MVTMDPEKILQLLERWVAQYDQPEQPIGVIGNLDFSPAMLYRAVQASLRGETDTLAEHGAGFLTYIIESSQRHKMSPEDFLEKMTRSEAV